MTYKQPNYFALLCFSIVSNNSSVKIRLFYNLLSKSSYSSFIYSFKKIVWVMSIFNASVLIFNRSSFVKSSKCGRSTKELWISYGAVTHKTVQKNNFDAVTPYWHKV